MKERLKNVTYGDLMAMGLALAGAVVMGIVIITIITYMLGG